MRILRWAAKRAAERGPRLFLLPPAETLDIVFKKCYKIML
jgi:hypothetical protein